VDTYKNILAHLEKFDPERIVTNEIADEITEWN
jgi:hypothetical protein